MLTAPHRTAILTKGWFFDNLKQVALGDFGLVGNSLTVQWVVFCNSQYPTGMILGHTCQRENRYPSFKDSYRQCWWVEAVYDED